ncbi:receptor-like serine/threonine-protein kinase SD1-8 [Cinnamomum micranthum f. kanehirae]|uniref:Receptor-like serine/threonine-protein kinase n=1 Tax=Cinnamomum micranthum f. kanehirae TaxID=337451 RepID=A0A3S3MXL1_9MAGN|nr:receptor-like serine/threonine-protein kinase SD1-8 [Cinnamomum micranthum f. kanehirae]
MSQRRMKITDAGPFFILFLTFCSFSSKISIAAQNTITSSTSLSGNDTLVSPSSTFELGFFVRGNSTYLGIWYKKISIHTVVWVANRDTPLANSTGILKIDGGNLILSDGTTVVWSSNVSKTAVGQPVAKLLDSGNFVLSEGGDSNSDSFLWQSFDYPSDTLLPGMKLGWNLTAGLNRFLTSWKNDNNPSSGDYTFKMDANGSAELILSFQLQPQYRSGPWNGLRFSGVPEMTPNEIFGFDVVSTPDEVYYTYDLLNSSLLSRLVLNNTGQLQRYTWAEQDSGGGLWSLFWWAPKDQCDDYSECGPYGVCDVNRSPVCDCVKGFTPKSPDDWYLRVTSGGCIRKAKLECGGDGFLKLPGMKLPDSSRAVANISMSLEDCRIECLNNCSCVAFASADIRGGGNGCIRWASDLIDLREYPDGGQDLYMRLPASQLVIEGGNNGRKRVTVIVTVTLASLLLLLGLGFALYCIRKKREKTKHLKSLRTGSKERSQDFPLTDFDSLSAGNEISEESRKEDFDLPMFDLETIAIATDNFSDINKLGRGGFGPVYKGKLIDGQEIAVKRLSKNSGQGLDEFKNEVILIAKLQHRNLVRLLGCCIQGEERLLIYEYMQNRSLDSIIFDEIKKFKLDWQNRFNIIMGIARGLLYLHQDSRFRIIHRDLKASNILLDSQMHPKISDFGMARIFGAEQMEANTRRVVGTFGYMSPEYAMDGVISVKSDVFSFGVIVLEIVTGKKNRGYYEKDQQLNLLGHAWKLWKEERITELMDASIETSCPMSEVLRCMHVGLLCVQERAEDRPMMSSAVLMLSSENARMPEPRQPGFCTGRSIFETDSSSSKKESCTINQVTVTMLESR